MVRVVVPDEEIKPCLTGLEFREYETSSINKSGLLWQFQKDEQEKDGVTVEGHTIALQRRQWQSARTAVPQNYLTAPVTNVVTTTDVLSISRRHNPSACSQRNSSL